MGGKVQAYLDDDLYDQVCDIQETTGKSKSEIVNEQLRDSMNSSGNWFLSSFSQSLFVIGFVLAAAGVTTFLAGVAISLFGLGMMLWFQVEEHAKDADTGYWEAFKRTLGVH